MIHSAPSRLPYFFVTEHPKSGGTWVGQMLADYLDVPFPRNRLPHLGSQIIHCHEKKIIGKNKKILVVLRDGRDVVTSYYYHSFFCNDLYNQKHVERIKKVINFSDYHDIENNLPEFIEFLYDKKYYPKLTWAEFTTNWINKSEVAIVRYENLLNDVPKELGFAISKLSNQNIDVDKLNKIETNYSFDRLKALSSKNESETKWLRKGISGDWKNNFNKKSRIIFDQLAGDALLESDYEKDRSWVNSS
ncbi:sulfotransferase domain-containing protein [Candidatus Pseudothioglobus singularis]|nr:sulfotransferase domain-containing protein [Candidatus Pseudothioglobus singularis]